jgi:hypothetical protein
MAGKISKFACEQYRVMLRYSAVYVKGFRNQLRDREKKKEKCKNHVTDIKLLY